MSEEWSTIQDANAWRKVPFVLLLAVLLIFGFFPRVLTDKIKPNAADIAEMANAKASAAAPPVNVAFGRQHASP
jgi:NADH:ubiquinone oxidoreductase subunit 4 (subunit M)